MRTRRYLVRCTVEPTTIRDSVTLEVATSADEAWRFMWDPASAPLWAPTVPGTPERSPGEVQVFVRRAHPEAPRTAGLIEVVELEEGRRAVTRSLASAFPTGGALRIEPVASAVCRVTQELGTDLPAGTAVTTVDAVRDGMRAELERVAEALRARFGAP